MATVQLSKLTKKFGSVSAVDTVDLEVASGEFVSFLGPSGCGKTTTLNMIAGLETPSFGSIRIDGVDVTHLAAMKRDIAMVFQSYALYPHMTVADNLGFALRVRGVEPGERRQRIAAAADSLGLGDLLDRYPKQLSGGQRQRVALGRALVRDPKVFLLDEPLSNLDAVLRVQTRAELKRLFTSLNTTAIYVTHDQAEAMTMSDRIAIFRNGKLQQVGTPLEIYRAPTNRFVASFVGSPPMTFLDGAIADNRIVVAGVTLVGTVPLASGPITVGFRPEDIAIGSGDEATIDLVEHLGSAMVLHLSLNGHTIVAQTTEDIRLRRGVRVPVQLSASKAYCFDNKTGSAVFTPGVRS